MKTGLKLFGLLTGLIVIVAVFLLTKPLAVETQREFFERAGQRSVLSLDVKQVGEKRIFNCLDVCNYVDVGFASQPTSLEGLNDELDLLLSEKYERKYDLVGNVFYNPADERNCTLIKRIKDIDFFDSCEDVQPFWQVKGAIAYGPIDEPLPDCEVITVKFEADTFTDVNEHPSSSSYNGEIDCKRNGSIDTYANRNFLEPLSCGNSGVCHTEEVQLRTY